MANQVKIDLSVQDNSGSIKKRTGEVQNLNKELTRSQQLATGTRTGAGAVRASYSAASESTAYGQARGSMGATGASGRDFANQAQGLGGLVRLYATYAANVFAVSAAFSALRDAMSTDIMIRGLDQLGTASGMALGGIAKQFAAASDGAISLREAMEATAKATSAGMSKKQFMELGAVAKGASQALGVNMSDAVSRLTRGITKLEPELLDELGIFTKVGAATEAYARSIGKSADSLTDFERRQAFANAVLEEGRTKFGEIAQQANPYDKLLAGLKDVAQSILSTVNTVVGPVVKILADNTALIGVAIAAAAIKITQQALPALASWRAGMKTTAEEAAKRAGEINTSFGEAFVERAQQRARVPQIQQAIKDAEAEFAQAKKQFVELDNIYKKPNATLRALQEDRLLSEKELVRVKSDITKKTNENTTASLKHALSLTNVQAAQQKILDLTKELTKANDIVEEQASKRSIRGSQEWQREQIVLDARAKAARLTLTSTVGDRVEKTGLGEGLRSFYDDVNANKDLGRFDKLRTKAVGTLAGIGTAASILGRSLSGAFVYLEIAVATFGILNMAFSKNGKEVDALKSGLDGLAESTKTANNVAEKYGNTLTTESLNAIANAFTNIAEGVKDTSVQLTNALASASWFDKLVNGFKSLWGGDLQTKFSEGLTDSITSAISVMPEGELKSSMEAKLKEALGTVTLGRDSISKALGSLSNTALKQASGVVTDILNTSKKALANSQALTQDVKEAGKSVSDAYLSLSNSIKDKSPVSTFLSASIKQAQALSSALKDAYAAQVVLKDIASGAIKPQFLTETSAIQLSPLAEEAAVLSEQSKRYSDNLSAAKARTQEINAEIQKGGNLTWYDAKLRAEREALKSIITTSEEGLASISGKLQDITRKAQSLIRDSIVSQINTSLEQANLKIQQLNIQAKTSAVSKLPEKTVESIDYTANLQKQALDVERMLYKSNESLVRSLDLLAIQVQRDADMRELDRVSQMPSDQVSRKQVSMLTARISTADQAIQAYGAKDIKTLKTLSYDNPQLRGLIESVQASVVASTGFAQREKQIYVDRDIAKIGLKYDELLAASQNRIKQLNIDLEQIFGTTAEADQKRAQIAAKIRQEQVLQSTKLPEERSIAITQALSSSVGNKAVVESVVRKAKTKSAESVALDTTASAAKDLNSELALKVKLEKESNDLTNARYATNNLVTLASEAAAKASIDYRLEELNTLNSIGAVSAQDFADKQKSLKLEQASLDLSIKLRTAKESLTAAEQAYNVALLENGGKETPLLAAQKLLYTETYKAAEQGAKLAYTEQQKLLDLNTQLTDRQKAYGDIVKNSFNSMADAIVQWAQTGKLSGKDLFNSLIADLARYELKLQMMSMYDAVRPGLMSGIAAVFGGSTSSVGSVGNATTMAPGGGYFAKGGSFDYGIQAFAKGGAFTNQIVDSPTLFKFAKGTGLMGEAGPEAIMPLKRDSNGNLGVRAAAAGGNTEVVVNNYSNAPAETRETRDDKGNRRIEVVIGEAASGEMSRPGSSTQGAMRNTYGIAPRLIRR